MIHPRNLSPRSSPINLHTVFQGVPESSLKMTVCVHDQLGAFSLVYFEKFLNCPLSQYLNVILSLLVGRFRYMLLVLVLGDKDSSVTKLGGTSVQVKIHHCLFQHLLWNLQQ